MTSAGSDGLALELALLRARRDAVSFLYEQERAVEIANWNVDVARLLDAGIGTQPVMDAPVSELYVDSLEHFDEMIERIISRLEALARQAASPVRSDPPSEDPCVVEEAESACTTSEAGAPSE